jgi:hypothetical protein
MDLDAFQTFSSKYRRAGISFVRCGGVTNVSHRLEQQEQSDEH